jgi:DNA-binding transcriptional MerR regulator
VRKLLTITELSKKLNLINSDDKKPLNHILRYWEKEFKQIRPKKIRNRRYYSPEQVETIKMIKFYIKDKGMTIAGVKNLLNANIKLDDYNSDSLKTLYYKNFIKDKSNSLLNKLKKIKRHGKKNSLKN